MAQTVGAVGTTFTLDREEKVKHIHFGWFVYGNVTTSRMNQHPDDTTSNPSPSPGQAQPGQGQ